MKKAVNIFLLAFYSFGTFCLPLGDFSVLQDIPEMYHHCKATEDKDMTPLDFITDHLVNIDGLFDKHDNGDEQKPHTPSPTQHHGQAQVTFITYFAFSMAIFHPIVVKPAMPTVNFIQSDYICKIFRPPIV
ncbi:MAG: hypothetical protein ACEQSL_06925 [Sediminibacterium sp.]